ncbi:hypothetical protein HDV00_001830 [Rhizophlyctis rosea]|nr:hypothetical protein HDV00_001830 [Rhizophlyctis rosea]
MRYIQNQPETSSDNAAVAHIAAADHSTTVGEAAQKIAETLEPEVDLVTRLVEEEAGRVREVQNWEGRHSSWVRLAARAAQIAAAVLPVSEERKAFHSLSMTVDE